MVLVLRPLRRGDEDVVRLIDGEMQAAGEGRFAMWLDEVDDWPAYLALHERMHDGVDLPAGRVPTTFLLAEVDGAVVGRVSIRHELNDDLLIEGGHVGYAVAPAHRRRGYATEVLQQSLDVLRGLDVDRVLVTCDDDNETSAHIIERTGGVLQDRVPSRIDARSDVLVRRYWIG